MKSMELKEFINKASCRPGYLNAISQKQFYTDPFASAASSSLAISSSRAFLSFSRCAFFNRIITDSWKLGIPLPDVAADAKEPNDGALPDFGAVGLIPGKLKEGFAGISDALVL